ncbi:hypothetical protein T08_221 [Trichinella sp. T8]|nr:hypothetical protein T08_221 [Trichinella sp. T8]
MLTLLASRIRRYLSKATILYKIVCNYDEIIKEFLAIFLNTEPSGCLYESNWDGGVKWGCWKSHRHPLIPNYPYTVPPARYI